jgi:hypothetical protein
MIEAPLFPTIVSKVGLRAPLPTITAVAVAMAATTSTAIIAFRPVGYGQPQRRLVLVEHGDPHVEHPNVCLDEEDATDGQRVPARQEGHRAPPWRAHSPQ